jgi:hypothetical protein
MKKLEGKYSPPNQYNVVYRHGAIQSHAAVISTLHDTSTNTNKKLPMYNSMGINPIDTSSPFSLEKNALKQIRKLIKIQEKLHISTKFKLCMLQHSSRKARCYLKT